MATTFCVITSADTMIFYFKWYTLILWYFTSRIYILILCYFTSRIYILEVKYHSISGSNNTESCCHGDDLGPLLIRLYIYKWISHYSNNMVAHYLVSRFITIIIRVVWLFTILVNPIGSCDWHVINVISVNGCAIQW